mgnify:FL=1|jgi:hypothetical protein
MLLWPDEIANMRFHPSDVEKLTGVSTDMQRLWAKRYGFDFRMSSIVEGERPRWNWEGIQKLVVFSDVFSDLRDAQIALRLGGLDNLADYRSAENYHYDHRNSVEDLLIHYEFGGHPAEGRTTASGFRALYDFGPAHHPGRSYLYNISSMQRRLWAARAPEVPS